MAKFIPESDGKFLAMAAAFAQGISANPGRYMLTPTDAMTITRAVDDYREAYDQAKEPKTRTVSAVSLKNQTRNSAVSSIRVYANIIRANMGISTQAMIDIGIMPPKTTLTRRPCPQSQPVLNFFAAETGRHGLKYADITTPNSPAKPFGAHALQLFMAISDYGSQAVRDPRLARYVGEYGRNPIVVTHEFDDAGKTATYFARWVGARNEHGPWSNPITVQVMFAGSPEHSQPNLKLAA